MKTLVVNVRDKNYDVYIGREGRGETGYFGNPVIRGKVCTVCGNVHPNRGSTLPCYEKYARERLSDDADFCSAVRKLRGRALGCFCAGNKVLTKDDHPHCCHGQVLAELAEELEAAVEKFVELGGLDETP